MRLVTSVLLALVLFGTPAVAQEAAPATKKEPAKEKPASKQKPAPKRKPAPKQTGAVAQASGRAVRAYAHLNFGGQFGSHDFGQQGTQSAFGETATFAVGGANGGSALFDIGGAYRVWRRVYAGLSYSRAGADGDVAIAALVPDPLRTNAPSSVASTAGGLKHVEHAVHLQAVWRQRVRVPFIKTVDVAAFAGPTFFSVGQDLVTGLRISEAGSAASFDGVTLGRSSESTVGFNVGVDGTYMVTRRLGVGLLLRYAGGSVDLSSSFGNVSLDIGGFHLGAGARVRF